MFSFGHCPNKGRSTFPNRMNFQKSSKWPLTPPLIFGKLYCGFRDKIVTKVYGCFWHSIVNLIWAPQPKFHGWLPYFLTARRAEWSTGNEGKRKHPVQNIIPTNIEVFPRSFHSFWGIWKQNVNLTARKVHKKSYTFLHWPQRKGILVLPK